MYEQNIVHYSFIWFSIAYWGTISRNSQSILCMVICIPAQSARIGLILFILVLLLLITYGFLRKTTKESQNDYNKLLLSVIVLVIHIYLIKALFNVSIDVKSWSVQAIMSQFTPILILLITGSITRIILYYHLIKIVIGNRKVEMNQLSDQVDKRNSLISIGKWLIVIWPNYYLGYMCYLDVSNGDFGLKITFLPQATRIGILALICILYALLLVRIVIKQKANNVVIVNKALLLLLAYSIALFAFKDAVYDLNVTWTAFKVMNLILIAFVCAASSFTLAYKFDDNHEVLRKNNHQ